MLCNPTFDQWRAHFSLTDQLQLTLFFLLTITLRRQHHNTIPNSRTNEVTMSENFNSVPYDTISLATDSVQVYPHWKVKFARLENGKISAQYSAARTTSCSIQHSTAQAADDATEIGPELVFANSVIAWRAFRDIGRTEMTAFTPEALEDAISRGGSLLTFTLPEISRLWTITDEPDGMCGLMP